MISDNKTSINDVTYHVVHRWHSRRYQKLIVMKRRSCSRRINGATSRTFLFETGRHFDFLRLFYMKHSTFLCIPLATNARAGNKPLQGDIWQWGTVYLHTDCRILPHWLGGPSEIARSTSCRDFFNIPCFIFGTAEWILRNAALTYSSPFLSPSTMSLGDNKKFPPKCKNKLSNQKTC